MNTRKIQGVARVHRQRGISMVESLVALVVIAVGMLGIAGLYLSSLQASRSAKLRSHAVELASSIADRIRANREAAAAYATDTYGGAPAEHDCETARCTPDELAEDDLAQLAGGHPRHAAGRGSRDRHRDRHRPGGSGIGQLRHQCLVARSQLRHRLHVHGLHEHREPLVSAMKSTHTMRAAARQSGLSMIELLVALAIGSFLIIGAVTMQSQSRRNFDVNEQQARVQENARYVIAVMEPELQLAGVYGYSQDPNSVMWDNAGDLTPPNKLRMTEPAAPGLPASLTSCGDNFAVDVLATVTATNGDFDLACAAEGGGQADGHRFARAAPLGARWRRRRTPRSCRSTASVSRRRPTPACS